MSVSQVLGQDKAVEILLALMDEAKYMRGLQRSVGGSPSTIQRRVMGLIEVGLIREVGGRGTHRDLELTSRGRALAYILASMDELLLEIPSKKPYLEGRQKWVLMLLHGVGPVRGTSRLEKLLFLLREEYEIVSEDFYLFKPHIFGPYSPELIGDLRDLRTAELIDVEEKVFGGEEMGDWLYTRKTYGLTDEGEEKAVDLYAELTEKADMRAALRRLQELNAMPLNNLLGYTWRRYPEYTRSED